MAATLVIYIFIVGCCLQVDLIPPCFNWFAPYPSPISCPSSHTKFKIIHSLINTLLHVILLNFDEKTPGCHAHIRSKKLNFCKNYHILWAKKVNRMPFFQARYTMRRSRGGLVELIINLFENSRPSRVIL